jgi:hypothetical protein
MEFGLCEKCKALYSLGSEERGNFDMRAIGELWRFLGILCTAGHGEGAMGRRQ